MILGLLVLVTALAISAVAIYYSVAGLMTIFAAAAIPIMIMGGTLEVGKLVTAVWLHKYWRQTTWWLKTYLTTAVIVLMFITSMGIFGFLSKAHIEQTASANEGIAQLERIDAEIERYETVIARAETKIQELESDGTGATAQLQRQIDLEQDRISSAYERIQPAIDEQNEIIAQQSALFQQELDKIDQELERLQTFINNDEIERAQAMVGTAVDGDYGPNTARAFQSFQDTKRLERSQWLERIQNAQQNDVVVTAREEIRRLRSTAETQIAESNALINNLREQLKSNNGNDLQTMLDEQQDRVRTASSEIDTLIDQKFQLEAEYRKLEAEVGPVKYIAEFIYGQEADKNLLEEAVRWVILIIIFVFDPLAVLLLIASQYTFEIHRKQKQEQEDLNKKQTVPEEDDPLLAEIQRQSQMQPAAYKKEQDHDESIEKANTVEHEPVRELVPEDDVSYNAKTGPGVEQSEIQHDGPTPDELARPYSEVDQPTNKGQLDSEPLLEKKDPELSDELKQARVQELEEQENDVSWSEAKRSWKEDHPDLTLKEFKEKYINNEIDHLPWEEYITDESKKKTYMIKEGSTQIRKTTDE